VADVIGRDVSFEELGSRIVEGFSQAFRCHLNRTPLTPAEEARAQELVETKYGTEQWNATPGRRR